MKNTVQFILLLLCQLYVVQSLQGQDAHYVPLNTSETIGSKTIDMERPVGATVAEAFVAQSGAANYSIPIVVPPGTNGMIPEISIDYNSQVGDGVMGRGWNIAGLSTITRTGQSIHFDGKKTPMNFSSTDRFHLDGQRLIERFGTYGDDGAMYRTESENFASITSHGAMGGSPEWFKVELKDGTVMEYGNRSDARLLNQDNTEVLKWRLNRIYYKDGNYIEFYWISTFRDNRIYEIKYTGNYITGQAPYNVVRFHYQFRTDRNTVYEHGSDVTSRYLLDRIEITAESSPFKEYDFEYSFDNYRSFLNSVTEKGTNGEALNSTIFKYGDQPTDFTVTSSSVLAGQNVDLFSGDFDGDGYSDILTAPVAYVNGVRYNTDLKVYKRTATNASFSQSYSTPLSPGCRVVNDVNTPSPRNFMASDYTGDGRDDVMTIQITTSSNSTIRVREFELYQSVGTSFTTRKEPPPSGHDIIHSSGKYFYPGDFDGDGATDYITFLGDGNRYEVFANFPSEGIYNQLLLDLSSPTAWVASDEIYVIDFDGDGKQELMQISGGTTSIYTFQRWGNTLRASLIYEEGYPTKWHRLYFGDFNGDRKTDILVRTDKTNMHASWEKALSTGIGFSVSPFSFNNTPRILGNYSDDKLVIADYNGDGMTDILHGNNNLVGSTLAVYYSRGDDFRYEVNTFSGNLGFVPLTVYDINGDGRSDLLNRTVYSQPFDVFSFKREGRELLMESAVDGHLNQVDFDYRRMNQTAGGFYRKGGNTGSTVNTVQVPIHLVQRMYQDDGIGGDFTTRYEYEEAKIHREGKGFLGFQYFTEIDEDNDVKRRHRNLLNTTYYLMYPYKTYFFTNSTNYQFRVNTYEYTFSPRPFIGYWIQLSSKREQQYLEDRLITYNYSYDLSGNLTTESKDFNGDYTQTVTTAYGQFGGPAPNRPTSITVLSQRPGQVSHSITSKLRYNNVGQVTQVQKYAGLPQQVTTDYTYHPLGNQKTETISAAGVLSRTTIKNYDSKGRFVTEIINPLGQSSTATYDIKWGKPISTTGIHGLTNTYAYDAFGRLIRNNRPEGYQTQESYGWDINQQLGTTHYYRQTFPGRPDVITYFDKLGRKRMVKTEGFQNQWITQSWTYDSRGRKKTERAPYMQGETTFTTTFNYDIYNRLINSSNPFGTTSYAYYYTNGILTTTVTNPDGETATAKTDAINLVIEAGDQGGTLHYTYNSQKLQTQTALGSTVALTTIYDVYGRKIQMTDKNAGTTTYAYNPFDEQTSHINARGDTYNMSYDRLGRMLRRTGPDEDRFFSYHGAGIPEANKVRYAYNSITYGGDAEYYFYDGFGRLDHLTTRIDGIDHQTYFEHNAYGDVIKKIFPSGFDLDYTYDANGYLLAINHQTTKGPINLFINQGMNGRNQCTSYYLGNNKTSTKSYNHGVPTRYHTQGIQDLQMSWDYSNGNLTNRFDVLKGLSESFNYDNLQRLTGSEVTGHPAQTTSYLPNGNINSKTDVGSYSYPPTTDNAVISVANSSGTIPTVTQDITYTGFDQPETLREGNYELTYDYGSNHERIKSTLRQNGSEVASRYYIGEYEKQVKNGVTQHLHYVNAGEGTIAIVESVNNVEKIYYTYTDHLGSILTVTDENAVVVAEQNFDAWGRKRNASNWTYAGVASVPDWLYRGYTAHEHMPEFQLINMNGRLYDPVLGRMLSPDNYIQDVANTQSYNRYAYVFNNPLKYTDPTGEAAVVKVIAVALYIGYATYTGGKFANNGEKDPREWDFSSSRTWKFLIIGAAIGYATGGLGAAVGIAGGAAGIKFSGLLSVMVSSLTNSMGLHILTGGYTPVYIHFGVASYDLTNNEVGYFGKKGNTLYENIGYAVGALKLYSDMKGSLGYGGKEMTSAAGGESLSELRPYTDPGGVSSGAPSKVITGGGHSPAHVTDPTQGMLYDINSGIDKTKLTNYGTHTKPNAPKPGAYSNLAVSHTNSVLMQTGQFNAAIQPYLLHAQAALRVFGFQAYLYSVQRLGND